MKFRNYKLSYIIISSTDCPLLLLPSPSSATRFLLTTPLSFFALPFAPSRLPLVLPLQVLLAGGLRSDISRDNGPSWELAARAVQQPFLHHNFCDVFRFRLFSSTVTLCFFMIPRSGSVLRGRTGLF